MEITRGKIPSALKVVIYGPEGIGKSTFAAQFPNPVFIDTEGSTKHMDVARLPKPSSWTMLLQEVEEIRKNPRDFASVVIDTADWAEHLCAEHVCAKAQKAGIEDFGYGKGYVYLSEEFGRLLNLLEDIVHMGLHVVLTAHAKMRKFEQPDELSAYDRWEMKLGKNTAPLVKEWADMVLFANYKTYTIKTEDKKVKAQGGARVMYAAHHPCWDAKNRQGLADELPFAFSEIAHCFNGLKSVPMEASAEAPEPVQTGKNEPEAGPPPEASGIPEALRELIRENRVSLEEIQQAVAEKGYFPEDMPVSEYPQDFVEGVLVAAWPKVFKIIMNHRDLPFD